MKTKSPKPRRMWSDDQRLPAAPRFTVRDLAALLVSLPPADAEYLDAVEEFARNQGQVPSLDSAELGPSG